MERRRVVITGMGAVTPLGLTCPDSWQAVREGVCGIAPITQFDASELKVKLAAEVKGFAPEERWRMAYDEINEFERSLARWGAVVLKFWLHIDQDEQLRRFRDRENTPEKRYKITAEDWRNREKWPAYQTAVDEMLQRTSTRSAPWIVVEGNDKKYARLKVLRAVREALEERLEG